MLSGAFKQDDFQVVDGIEGVQHVMQFLRHDMIQHIAFAVIKGYRSDGMVMGVFDFNFTHRRYILEGFVFSY